MEIIGKIENISLTCCTNIDDLLIGDISLYDKLSNYFNLNNKDFYENSDLESPLLGVSYVISEIPFDETLSYNDIVADAIFSQLYAQLSPTCYSEYTCGYGDFNFFIRKEHSIFFELSSYIDKYVWLNIKSIRSLKIDKLLSI